MIVNQKEFKKLLEEHSRAEGYARTQVLKDIFAAREKDDRILIWKNQQASQPTVEMATVQFFDDKKAAKRNGVYTVDDSFHRMTRVSINENGFYPKQDRCSGEFVSPEAMVSEIEEVNIYNLIDVTGEEAAMHFAYAGKFPGFQWFWDIVNKPRDFTIIHREELVTHFYVEGVTTVEEALKEYEYRAANGEYDYGDMEMVDSSEEAVPDDKM